MSDSRKANDQIQFDECVDRGRRLWAALRTQVNSHGPDQDLQSYGGRYRLKVKPNALSPLVEMEENILEDLGDLLLLENWTQMKVFSWEADYRSYHNYVDRTGRALVSVWNDKSWDRNGSARMPWDYMMARIIADVTAADCITNLQWAIQDCITNKETQNAMRMAFRDYPPQEYPPFLDIFPEDEHGEPNAISFGLLGTPNVKGTVRLLTNFAKLFGYKTIARIRTTPGSGGSPTLVICPEDFVKGTRDTALKERGISSEGKRRVVSDGMSAPESKKPYTG